MHNKNFTTSLAPMRGLSSLKFINCLAEIGEPDEYISEFLRVHPTSKITTEILELVENWASSKPLSIQLMGKDPAHFLRIGRLLQNYKINAINLNFGCPMPKIKKKGVGGALLKELGILDEIMSVLTDNISCQITVKMRLGHDSSDEFPALLDVLEKYDIAVLYLHARTVRSLYSGAPDLGYIKLAKSKLRGRVIANGDINTADQAVRVIESTGADGVMIGRAAISNPWIFRQINDLKSQRPVFQPSGKDFLEHIEKLIKSDSKLQTSENAAVAALKKHLVPIADFLDKGGMFAYKIRRAQKLEECRALCSSFFVKRPIGVEYK